MPTNISWTNETWNPVTGCSHVSEGCRNCYAEALSLRHGWSKKPWTARNAAENVKLHPDRLDQPLRWQKPRMVFVNSMSDLFHDLVPFEFIDQVFATMAAAKQHTFQLLTKRPDRMRAHSRARLQQIGTPLPNVWLGVSCEDQPNADERIPELLQTPAAVRFLSCEPLLGPIKLPVSLRNHLGHYGRCTDSCVGLDWVIAGGESGRDYRVMDIAWARELRDQCHQYGVPFFMKQDSGSRPGKQGRIPDDLWVQEFPQSHEPATA